MQHIVVRHIASVFSVMQKRNVTKKQWKILEKTIQRGHTILQKDSSVRINRHSVRIRPKPKLIEW